MCYFFQDNCRKPCDLNWSCIWIFWKKWDSICDLSICRYARLYVFSAATSVTPPKHSIAMGFVLYRILICCQRTYFHNRALPTEFWIFV